MPCTKARPVDRKFGTDEIVEYWHNYGSYVDEEVYASLSVNKRFSDQQIYAKKYKSQGRKYKRWYRFGVWYDDERSLYVKLSRYSISPYLKKSCNKQVRRSRYEDTPTRNKGKYKRISMYWNNLF